MSKTASAAFLTSLGEEHIGLASLATITRLDGTVYYLTDHDRDIVYSGNTYLAAGGFDRSALENEEGTAVGDVDFKALLDNTIISDTDLRAGLFNYARIQILAVNFFDLTDGHMVVFEGRFGSVTISERGFFKMTARSKKERLRVATERKILPTCSWDLGDPLSCRVPINPDVRQDSTAYAVGDWIKVATTAGTGSVVYQNRIYECTVAGTSNATPPTFNTVVGNTTADGTVTWKAYESWTRSGTVATVVDNVEFTVTLTEARAVDDWFSLGGLVFETGNNLVEVHEIRDWVSSTNTVKLAIEAKANVQVGDLFRIWPGCNRVITGHCSTKFVMSGSADFAAGNGWRFGGFPHLPGRKRLLRAPSPDDYTE